MLVAIIMHVHPPGVAFTVTKHKNTWLFWPILANSPQRLPPEPVRFMHKPVT
jgi:hypothetical protein